MRSETAWRRSEAAVSEARRQREEIEAAETGALGRVVGSKQRGERRALWGEGAPVGFAMGWVKWTLQVGGGSPRVGAQHGLMSRPALEGFRWRKLA